MNDVKTESQSQESKRYLLTYKERVMCKSALKSLGESPLYLFSPVSRTIGAEIQQGLLKKLEELGLFEEIKPDPVKRK